MDAVSRSDLTINITFLLCMLMALGLPQIHILESILNELKEIKRFLIATNGCPK